METLKTEGMDCLERSWESPEKFVCADCVEDIFLKNMVSHNLAKRKCEYCGKSSRGYVAAPVRALMEPIASALFDCFSDQYHAGLPDELDLDELPTTAEALRGIPLKCHETLLKDVAAAFWCDRWVENSGSFDDPGSSMNISWGKFVRTVKWTPCPDRFSRNLSYQNTPDIFL